jgi:hypothetical protein
MKVLDICSQCERENVDGSDTSFSDAKEGGNLLASLKKPALSK